MPFTIPPGTATVGSGNPPVDMNNVAGTLTTASRILYNVQNSAWSGGADPSGAADSTAAFQAAQTAAAAAGVPVFVSNGTYKVSNVTMRSYAGIVGEGPGVILQGKSGSTGYVVALDVPSTTTQTQLRNITVKPASGQGGVQIDNTSFAGYPDSSHLLEDVWVQNAGGDGFHFDHVVRELRATRCHVYGATGFGFYIGADCTDSRFTDCTAATITLHGWEVLGNEVDFTNCKAFFCGYNGSTFDTTHSGWHLNSAYLAKLVNCDAQQNALHGIDMQSSTFCSVVANDADTNGCGGTGTGAGININATLNSAIIGNVGNDNTGLTAHGQSYGLQVAGTCTGTWLDGNTVTGDTAAFHFVGGASGYTRLGSDEIDISTIPAQKVGSLWLAPDTTPGSPATVTTGSTVTWFSGYGTRWLTASGAVTGLILSVPTALPSASVEQVITNMSAFPMTFAAAGTSNVATGAADTIMPGVSALYIWDGNTLWHRTGPPQYTVNPDLSLLLAPAGVTAETFPRGQANQYTSVLVSGTPVVSAIPLPGGLSVANLGVIIGSTGFTGVTHGWIALLDSGLVVRAVTADQTSSFGSAGTKLQIAATAAYVTTTAALYYKVACVTATGMGTLAIGNEALSGANSTAPILAGTSGSGLTTPPALGTTMTALTAGGTWRFYGFTA